MRPLIGLPHTQTNRYNNSVRREVIQSLTSPSNINTMKASFGTLVTLFGKLYLTFISYFF